MPSGVTGDFFGQPRVLVGKFEDAATVDIGAAEFAPSAPLNSGLPVISGNPVKGQTLATTNGSWSGTTNAFGYQWQDCDPAGNACSNIAGATGNVHQLGDGDVGHTLRVVVTALNAGGSTSARSDKTAIVAAPPVLTRVRLAPPSFTATKGTRLKLTLATQATIRVVITQTVRGHKIKGRCRPGATRGNRCRVTLTRATRTLDGAPGANSIKLNLSHLAPGRYRATIVALNSVGTSSGSR